MLHVTDKTGRLLGRFSTVAAAKFSRPDVHVWRRDESRGLGWNGWIAKVASGEHDYEITFVGSNRGGFVRAAGDGQPAVVVKSPFAS